VSDDHKIYVDGGQSATLNNGAGALTDCATLQEAVLAWHSLPPDQKIRATVKVIGAPVYTRMRSIDFIMNQSRRDATPLPSWTIDEVLEASKIGL